MGHPQDAEPRELECVNSWRRSSPFVRVTCREPSEHSVCGTFHVELPPGANVAQFRQALRSKLSFWTEVLMRKPGGGYLSLSDDDLMPDKIIVNDMSSDITL